ncbi:MAG: hypothetical protein VB050_04725 [Geobacteraceae bacterium]|nr:hypothetical protein [Geobacteraceae bacterium]
MRVVMGLGCSDESRQKYGKWCALLDWIVGTAGAATPDPGGVVAVGTAVLDPGVLKAGISAKVHLFNCEMAAKGSDVQIDQAWAEQHPMEALRELKRLKGN